MGVRLPAEYQEVEYLEATGSQAFFTDVPIQDNLTVDSVQTFNGGDTYLFGGYNGKGLQACFNGYFQNKLQSSYSGYYFWGNVNSNNQTIYHVVLTQKNGEQIGVLNGSQVLSDTRTTTGDSSAGEYAVMFGQRNSSGRINEWYRGKVYSCKVSKGNELLANYVPCYRKSDNKPGMYDMVLHKFYVNELTGEFLVGQNVIDSISPLMVAWRRIMMAVFGYSGYTLLPKVTVIRPYGIDTEYVPTADTSVEVKYKSTITLSGGHFLACTNYYILAPRSLAMRLGNSSGIMSSLNGVTATISCYRNSNDVLVNGEVWSTLTPGSSQASGTFSLLTYNMAITSARGFIGVFYYARIYDNNVLIRNYVPAKDIDGHVGILETLSRTFYYGTDANPAFIEYELDEVASSTGLVSFDTNVEMPTKVTCEFSPVQDLSHGDPSPENECPIGGWTGCEIPHTGKNLFDMALLENGSMREDGTDVPSVNAVRSKGFVPIKANVQYVLSCNGVKSSLVKFFRSDGVKISETSWISTPHTFTCPDGTTSVRFLVAGQMDNVSNVLLELGSTSTDYESYQGETIPITFTDPDSGDPLTVYGGTVTLNEDGSADLVKEFAKWVEDGSRQPSIVPWGTFQNVTWVLFGPLPAALSQKGSSAQYISNNRKFININKRQDELNCFACYSASNFSFAYSVPNTVTNKEEAAAYFQENPTEIVYPLATPQTYHFDNIGQLKTFLGTNNIWHSMNGGITVEYHKK